jgi:hypothetical protein
VEKIKEGEQWSRGMNTYLLVDQVSPGAIIMRRSWGVECIPDSQNSAELVAINIGYCLIASRLLAIPPSEPQSVDDVYTRSQDPQGQ